MEVQQGVNLTIIKPPQRGFQSLRVLELGIQPEN